ncbi:protein phosphatase CheZ [Pseudohongiella spirulinae]|uniref:Protein phosphatase CheZ n=1 Tax=Pseudohongiella spirulinae TaxID=1249552 RepID=A0A0S2KDC7_9GAMM|nr:protein phosphatase CheZ [Pseudohongiella spirulinae]ALO46321.1 protein phosphatase [Pseudohongiella spirulinae]
MSEIDQERYERLYHEVGRLTRALHTAIRDFHLGIGLQASEEVEHELSEMADARSRLNYVIKMTEEAANKTMDRVDEAAPVIRNMVDQGSALQADWTAYLADRKLDAEQQQLFDRVSGLLDLLSTQGAGIHEHLTEILMAQGFQDLSGQVIKRVIELVSDVEKSLVNLVKLASNVEQIAGIESGVSTVLKLDDEQSRIRAEGPQVKSGSKRDVVSGQDDVDDLLSSLGF